MTATLARPARRPAKRRPARKPPTFKAYTQDDWAAGAEIIWTDRHDDAPRRRTGLAWGPGKTTGSLWVIPDTPDPDEAAVLLVRQRTGNAATRRVHVEQTQTRTDLTARLRRTNALAAPGTQTALSVTQTSETHTVTRTVKRRKVTETHTVRTTHHTAHLAACPDLPALRAAADTLDAERTAILTARTSGTPAARKRAQSTPLPDRDGGVGPAGTTETVTLMHQSRDGKPPQGTDQYRTGTFRWCPTCLHG